MINFAERFQVAHAKGNNQVVFKRGLRCAEFVFGQNALARREVNGQIAILHVIADGIKVGFGNIHFDNEFLQMFECRLDLPDAR